MRLDRYGRTVVIVTVGDQATAVGHTFVVVSLFEVGFTRQDENPRPGNAT